MTGATADGRLAGEPMADSLGPSQGSALHGPTAVIRSVTRLDHSLLSGGSVFNVRFSLSDLKKDENLEKVAALVEAYLRLGGSQIQPCFVDVETLKDAYEHPELHRDLVVRVVGYSARFTDLAKELQLEVIARSEMKV
ncbi:MAG: glycine radical domain-containing protein [bacterium]